LFLLVIMAKIKQLSHHEAQKIAAGEVVERPANIVKELIENSIDAHATRISLYIEDAGKQLIRVVDNGCGMDVADAQICFDRHATSKITHVDQLETIGTFGFRGEALASIAAVSQISLITKEESTHEGTKIVIHANSIQENSSIACITGTDISVHNLFFNVPARKKFLKTTQTEWRVIQLLFNAFCFDYPHIHFTLFSDGKQILNCPATTLKNRSVQLWEPATNHHIIELHTIQSNAVTIEGFISDHQHYRYDRTGIYLFVNKRWVKNQHLASALIKGYANVVPEGRYPLAIISITAPSHEIDINIHPRKEEVKFLHPRQVEQALQQAVKTTLENNISRHIKSKEVVVEYKPFNYDASFFTPREQIIFEHKTPTFVAPLHNSVATFAKNNGDASAVPFMQSETQQTIVVEKFDDSQQKQVYAYHLIGQYKKTYLLIEKEEGLFLVDQHAAHERILYELFSMRFDEVATIQLLFPQIITLPASDLTLITPYLTILQSNGIIIEQCATNQLIVQSLPVHLKEQSMEEIVKLVISWITEYQALDEDALQKTINEKLHAQMACKAAVKAGDVLSIEKMHQLLADLEKTANRFSCPHGRPTGWLLSVNEIEKKFKRRT
jgi:DNA mismatch repair protein MutL